MLLLADLFQLNELGIDARDLDAEYGENEDEDGGWDAEDQSQVVFL